MKVTAAKNTFTRPGNTTPYASGQIVANSTTGASVVPVSLPISLFQQGMQIYRVRLSKSSTTTANANFRVHLFRNLPTVTSGDGATLAASGVDDYIGVVDVTMGQAFTDGAVGFGVANTGAGSVISTSFLTASTVYALIEARAAYVPASGETFTVMLEDVAYG